MRNPFEHFQAKWVPVRRQKMRPNKEKEAAAAPGKRGQEKRNRAESKEKNRGWKNACCGDRSRAVPVAFIDPCRRAPLPGGGEGAEVRMGDCLK
jgi:hypothetical protein